MNFRRPAATLFAAQLFAFAALAVSALLAGCNSGTTTALPATSVSITTSTTSVNVGGSFTATATLSGGSNIASAIGTIVFYDGTNYIQPVVVSGPGTVTATISNLAIGAHQITAVYGGDQTHAASTSPAITVNVYDPTSLSIASNFVIAGVGDPIILTVTANGGLSIPTGTVTFTVTSTSGTSTIGTAALATVNGTAIATLPYTIAAPTGTQTFKASLAANGFFLGSSTTTGAAVTVHPPLTQDTVTLSGSLANNATIAAGTSDTLTATIVPLNTTKGAPTGTVTFYDGSVNLGTTSLNSAGTSATLTTKQFVTGSNNTLTAFYSGDANYAPNYTTNSLALTLQPYTGANYTNPLSLTDTVNNTGKVYNCPDPSIIKYQTGGTDTWYAYCTGDAFNATDTVTPGGSFRAHLVSIFSSTDLVNWTYVRDALPALPTWAAAGQELQTPSIKLINGVYTLYFTANASASPNGPAIGYATATTPAGPFTVATSPLINQSLLFTGGPSVTKNGPEVVTDNSGNLWITYGGPYGGIVINQLNTTGTATVGGSISIGVDNYYTNPYIRFHGGYFYEFATPAGACCGGAFSTYSVRVGRSSSITGPYLDAEGNDMNAFSATSGTNGAPGGDTVLVNTGNTIVGPGSNTTFTDESGQDYILYSGVSTLQQYLPNVTGYTARQLMMDPLDWVNGWPVVRNGTGDSDQPQPVPAAQPNATNGYVPPVYTPDTPGTLLPAYSQDFTGATAFASQFSVIHGTSNLGAGCLDPGNGFAGVPGVSPGFGATGFTLCSAFGESTNVPGTSYSMTTIPIPAEAEPTGNYLVEVKFHSLTPPTGCCSYNYPAQGLFIYSTDTVYLRLDGWADFDTRQIEFLNSFGLNTSNNTAYTAFAPVGTSHNSAYTYLRLAKRITNTSTGAATYTSYASIDGVTWVRGPAWNVNYGTGAKIGIFADNLGEGATFSYIHVSTLAP
jgi:arabinan endo-1,5-alpha-L-arabinosidase